MHGLRAPVSAALGLSVICLAQLIAVPAALGATPQTFIVLYKEQATPADARAIIRSAGGTLVATYSQIGVVIARSSSASFAEDLLADPRVEGAAATTKFAARLANDVAGVDGQAASDLPSTPATDEDSLSPLQWDMRQIKTPQAHAITGGSPSVLVGDIDTGIDFDHPDRARVAA